MPSSRAKKIIFLILALFLIGLFIYFVFLFKDQTTGPTINHTTPNGESQSDTIDPVSQIISPESNTWHNFDFEIEAIDEDLGSGLNNSLCQFNVFSLEQDFAEHSSGWLKRKCNSKGTITVGQEKRCAFEGRQACWVYIASQDKAGNTHKPSQEAKSIRYYNIDWTKPEIGKVFIQENQDYPINVKENTEYDFKVKVTDNLKITGCTLYINNDNQGKMSAEIPGCDTQCTFVKKFTPQTTGSFNVFAACQDAALNRDAGTPITAKTNLLPEISYCRVEPTQGTIDTSFKFFVEASDPDNDDLSAKWSFDDQERATELNPTHKYKQPGTYNPEVTIFDGNGGQNSCSTAWITVTE
jgi:hypothetical protein